MVVSERVDHRGEFFQTTPVPLAEPLRNDYPEIEEVMRLQLESCFLYRAFWDGLVYGSAADKGNLKQIKIISLKFKTDNKSRVIGLELYEPAGV